MASEQPNHKALIEAARAAREWAYIPYSRFAVGAAVLTASGRIFPGCNIENAAYSVTVCAERTALFNAYAAGEREIIAIAVVADTSDPVSPCGMCRQAIHELAAQSVVILANMSTAVQVTSPQALLPYGFDARELP